MRILVKGLNWLGDAVMSLPTLRSLRDLHPRATIDVLTKPALASLYRAAPYVDETLPQGSFLGTVRAIRRAKYDAALVLPRSFSSAFLAFSSGIPRRIGYASGGRSALLTEAVPRDPALLKAHRVHYYHHLLGAFGTPPRAAGPKLELPEEARAWAAERLPGPGSWVALNPGATYGAAKQWFPDRFVEVGRTLARDHRVAVIGGPSEAALGRQVAEGIGERAACLAGRTDLPQLAALLARCDLLLTNDTGPMHVADAVGTPIVAVFGPTDWISTPPFGKRHEIVRHEIECSPCLQRVCPLGHHDCMKKVRADVVAAACRRVLGGSR